MESPRLSVLRQLVSDMDEDIAQSYLPEPPAEEAPVPESEELSADDLSVLDALPELE